MAPNKIKIHNIAPQYQTLMPSKIDNLISCMTILNNWKKNYYSKTYKLINIKKYSITKKTLNHHINHYHQHKKLNASSSIFIKMMPSKSVSKNILKSYLTLKSQKYIY